MRQNKSIKKNDLNIKTNKRSNKITLQNTTKPIILKTFKVSSACTLLDFLYSHIKNDSKNNIKKYLTNHQVLVNGVAITQFDFSLSKEDIVQISKNKVLDNKNENIKLDIIYEDDELIAINKPSGLLSIESDNEKTNTAYRMLTNYVQRKDKKCRIYIVHRIDKDTSGVLVVAKNENIKNKLQHNWANIVKNREYIAICEGVFENEEGTIKSYLKENINHLMYSSKDKSGKYSITHYQVLKSNGKYSMVDVKIDSGRKNQIRVHMLDLNHKVVGDEKYGPVSNPINRLGLHAYKLEFIHPVNHKLMSFKANIPEIFNSLFKK